MPHYIFQCKTCSKKEEAIQSIGAPALVCCGAEMDKLFTSPAVIRVMDGKTRRRSKAYKDAYSDQYLREVCPERY